MLACSCVVAAAWTRDSGAACAHPSSQYMLTPAMPALPSLAGSCHDLWLPPAAALASGKLSGAFRERSPPPAALRQRLGCWDQVHAQVRCWRAPGCSCGHGRRFWWAWDRLGMHAAPHLTHCCAWRTACGSAMSGSELLVVGLQGWHGLDGTCSTVLSRRDLSWSQNRSQFFSLQLRFFQFSNFLCLGFRGQMLCLAPPACCL